jgi:PAS domain S-box-containing protein
MNDEDKSKGELIAELGELRGKVARLEGVEEELKQALEGLRRSKSSEKSSDDPTETDENLPVNTKAFHALMDNSPFGAFLKNDQGRLVYVNKQWKNRLNKTFRDVRDNPTDERRPGKTGTKLGEIDRTVLDSNEAVEFVETLPDKEGKPAYWWTQEFPIRDSSGRLFIGGIALNITESKRAEQELRKTKEELEALLNATSDAAHLIDTSGRVLALNQPSAERLGATVEEVRGKVLFDFFPPEIVESAKDNLRRIVKTGKPARFERDLGSRTFDTNLYPVFGAEGAVEGMAVFARDITETKLAAQSLQESEERYRKLAENSLTGIFIHQDDRAVYINPHLSAMTGYSPEEMSKLDLLEPIHPEDRAAVARIVRERAEGETGDSQHEVRLITKDGDIKWAVVMATRINYRGKPATIGNIADITHRKKAEQQIRIALDEKELLLREIHHRVKNNLQVMSSLLKLQSRRTGDKAQQVMLMEAENRVRSMALAHERMCESESLTDVNLLKYIVGLVNYISAAYDSSKREIKVETCVRDVSLGINTAVPLGFILNELLSNCFKHAFPDAPAGHVTISLKPIGAGQYELIVADDGVGMPQDIDHKSPTTLGLELVGIFADQLQAQIEVRVTGGTEFRIRFKEL